MSQRKEYARRRIRVSTPMFTVSDVYTLIEQVKMHPIIWDVTNPHYTKRDSREATWMNIEEHFGHKFSVPELQVKWGNLRVQFRTNRAKDNTSWRYLESMMFIDEGVEEGQMVDYNQVTYYLFFY